MTELETDVLVVGAGPVGMTCALIASSMGARVTLVDRKEGVSYYPKARALTARSLEIFRQLGLESAIHEAMPPTRTRHYAFAQTLISPDVRLVPFGLAGLEPNEFTPCTGSYCTQDRLEPILEARLRREPRAEIRFGTELVELGQSDEEARALVRVVQDGAHFKVRSRLVVAADGANSRCAELLGLGMDDIADLEPAITVIFKAQLSPLIDPLNSVYALLGDARTGFGAMLSGVSLARDPEEWSIVTTTMPEWGADLTAGNADRWREAIRAIVGIADLAIEISAVAKWRRTASVARDVVHGRVAFAGDSAHLMPPAGGLGLNTGLQDAHNLAWRMVAILNGSSLSLLDDYELERRPEIVRAVDAAHRNYFQGNDVANIWSTPQIGLSLGVQYEAGTFERDGPASARTYPYHTYEPSGRPGGRAPHFWLDEAAGRSVLDLFGRGFVLLAERVPSALRAAVKRLREKGAPLVIVNLADETCEMGILAWRRAYAVTPDGIVLVRPDGHIAWRSTSDADGLEERFWALLHNTQASWAPANA